MFPTLASYLVKQLQAIIDKHGDLPIATQGGDYYTSRVSCEVSPYYYDGGYLIPCDPPGYACNHWVESRSIVGTEVPNKFIKIIAGYPCDENDTIDGTKVIFTNPTYLDLVADFTPRPIKSVAQRAATQEAVDKLIDKTQPLNQDEQDYLSVLGTLLWEYDTDSMPDTWFEELI